MTVELMLEAELVEESATQDQDETKIIVELVEKVYPRKSIEKIMIKAICPKPMEYDQVVVSLIEYLRRIQQVVENVFDFTQVEVEGIWSMVELNKNCLELARNSKLDSDVLVKVVDITKKEQDQEQPFAFVVHKKSNLC